MFPLHSRFVSSLLHSQWCALTAELCFGGHCETAPAPLHWSPVLQRTGALPTDFSTCARGAWGSRSDSWKWRRDEAAGAVIPSCLQRLGGLSSSCHICHVCHIGARTTGQGFEQDTEMIWVKHNPSLLAQKRSVTGMTGAMDAVLQEKTTKLTYILTCKDAYTKGLLKKYTICRSQE